MLGGAVGGGLGTPSSSPPMLFLPSLVVIPRATLEPDATIDPSLHLLSLSLTNSQKSNFFLVTRNFYFTKVNVIYIRVRARVDNQKKDCRDSIKDEYIPRAFIPLDLVLCGRKHVSNDDSLRGISVESFSLLSLSLFLAGYFGVRL